MMFYLDFFSIKRLLKLIKKGFFEKSENWHVYKKTIFFIKFGFSGFFSWSSYLFSYQMG